MRIGLQSMGTYGDFVPFLALSHGLAEAGHEVTLIFTSLDGQDYSHHSAERVQITMLNDESGRNDRVNLYRAYPIGGSLRELSNLLRTYYEPFTNELYRASEKLCQASDLVIGHMLCHTLLTASIKHGCPRVSLLLIPLVFRSKETTPFARDHGSLINSVVWKVGDLITTNFWFKEGGRIRRREGIPKMKSLQKEQVYSDLLTLMAASDVISPRPHDWPQSIKYTGFLNAPKNVTNCEMPNDLRKFLNAGEPPVYFTFGSCTQYDKEGTRRLFIEAARLSGKRAIVQCDWSDKEQSLSPDMYPITAIPYELVFPYCSCVVHHGGAGTTQAALCAGKPSVVVAHCFDQTYWARQLSKMGVGGRPMLKRTVSARDLATQIKLVAEDPLLAQNAAEMGRRMSQENGVAEAVRLISGLENNLQ